jgi:DNA-binding NarL/FixJ family response regulator
MRVLIVDDHPIVASGCRALFGEDPEIVILEASDAESGERAFVDERFDSLHLRLLRIRVNWQGR